MPGTVNLVRCGTPESSMETGLAFLTVPEHARWPGLMGNAEVDGSEFYRLLGNTEERGTLSTDNLLGKKGAREKVGSMAPGVQAVCGTGDRSHGTRHWGLKGLCTLELQLKITGSPR